MSFHISIGSGATDRFSVSDGLFGPFPMCSSVLVMCLIMMFCKDLLDFSASLLDEFEKLITNFFGPIDLSCCSTQIVVMFFNLTVRNGL